MCVWSPWARCCTNVTLFLLEVKLLTHLHWQRHKAACLTIYSVCVCVCVCVCVVVITRTGWRLEAAGCFSTRERKVLQSCATCVRPSLTRPHIDPNTQPLTAELPAKYSIYVTAAMCRTSGSDPLDLVLEGWQQLNQHSLTASYCLQQNTQWWGCFHMGTSVHSHVENMYSYVTGHVTPLLTF